MGGIGFLLTTIWGILMLFCVVPTTPGPTSVRPEVVTYDEYIIEHALSWENAKNVALSLDLNSIHEPAGCQKCTQDEIQYCLGRDLVSDHCCCDMNYSELLPFIPHTCYFGKQLCTTVAEDCAEYQRLLICCCNRHTLIKWKQKASASMSYPPKTIFLLLLLALYIFL